jgi:TetR/AcrR family transcriptional regulator
MPRGRASGYDAQRDRIVARAAALFAERGYAGTPMSEVARASGVSKASLYHYVDDKYGLLVEIAEGHVERLRALARDAAAIGEAQARLAALIERFMAAYAGARAAHRVLTEDVRFLEPADRRRVLEGQREVVRVFAAAVAEARPDLASARLEKPLAMLLFGMMNWMFTWLRPNGDLTHADMTPVVVELFLGGLAAVRAPAAHGARGSRPRLRAAA